MKKFLVFIGGFVAGIIATILVAFLINVANEYNDSLRRGLTLFPEKVECMAIKNEIEVFQVLEPNMALARTGNIGDIIDRIVILLVNYEGETYYDQQKIIIPANKCARQIGTYQYTSKDGNVNTVPAVVIDDGNNGLSIIENNNQSSSRQSLGNLRNTRWHYRDLSFVGNDLISIEESIEFGNGNYIFNSKTERNSSNQAAKTEIGTFRVSGDNVILTSSDGKEKNGIIVGRSLTIDGRTYR